MLPKKCPLCHKKSLQYQDDFIYCPSCKNYKKKLNLLQKPLVWANNKSWILRVPILFWFGYMLRENINNPKWSLNRLDNPFSAIDLGIHELGHKIFIPFGEFMTILGGSIFQCFFPVLCFAAFIKQKWYFASSLCFCWLGINLFDVAGYVADARAREIPLSIGPAIFSIDASNTDAAYDSAHDWYQILSRIGRLQQDIAIANNLRLLATIFFIVGLVMASILVVQMILGSIQRHLTNKAE